MNTNIEELKFVADLAHNGGVMQAQNDALKAEVERLKAEIDNQNEMNLKKDDIIAAQNQRIAELVAMLHQQDSQPKVVVNNFFLLSCHKTVALRGSLHAPHDACGHAYERDCRSGQDHDARRG